MRIDAAGHHQPPARVQCPRALQPQSDRLDFAVRDADVGAEHVGWRHHGTALNRQMVLGHRSGVLACADDEWTPRGCECRLDNVAARRGKSGLVLTGVAEPSRYPRSLLRNDEQGAGVLPGIKVGLLL